MQIVTQGTDEEVVDILRRNPEVLLGNQDEDTGNSALHFAVLAQRDKLWVSCSIIAQDIMIMNKNLILSGSKTKKAKPLWMSQSKLATKESLGP
jgi:hypothetical protein